MDIEVCRSVISRLQQLDPPALHVGSLALGLPPTHYSFDDLHLLIHENCLGPFCQAMERDHGFHLVGWYPSAHGTYPALPGALAQRPLPLTPDLGYSDRIGAPCTLWIQFYTNRRHGPLLLVDLEDWFNHAEVIPLPVLGDPLVSLARPPIWALLLWQASLVTNCAADRADPTVIRAELGKLHELAGQLSNADWMTLVQRAQDYDREYLGRLERIRPRIGAYAIAHGGGALDTRLIASPPPPGIPDVGTADLDYGVLHDLRHALEALAAYHPGTVRPQVTAAVQQGTGARPRKLWHYPPTPGNVGELGTAAARFGIRNQIEQYAALTWDELKNQELVVVGIHGAPPQGYWQNLTPGEFRAIFAPLPP